MNSTLFIIIGAILIVVSIIVFIGSLIYKNTKVKRIKSKVLREYK